jgi:hypothetical protein
MIKVWFDTYFKVRSDILEISFNNTFAEQLCEYSSKPFDVVNSTYTGIPCVIRLNQTAPFLITIQGGKK